jgi:hypothetical protein
MVILLTICTSTYAHAIFPSMMDSRKDGIFGIFWKAARIGERLSPYVGVCCLLMAVGFLFSLVVHQSRDTYANDLIGERIHGMITRHSANFLTWRVTGRTVWGSISHGHSEAFCGYETNNLAHFRTDSIAAHGTSNRTSDAGRGHDSMLIPSIMYLYNLEIYI